MTRLSKGQRWFIIGLLILGVCLTIINTVPIVFISIGSATFAMGLVFLFLECGPAVWHWWIPFGLGYDVVLETTEYMDNADNIKIWLENNMKYKYKYNNFGDVYYFLYKTDATGFKLRWL